MSYKVPDRYSFAVLTPPGGACCANCVFFNMDEHPDRTSADCHNAIYRAQNDGSGEIGDIPEQFCCAVWSGKMTPKQEQDVVEGDD